MSTVFKIRSVLFVQPRKVFNHQQGNKVRKVSGRQMNSRKRSLPKHKKNYQKLHKSHINQTLVDQSTIHQSPPQADLSAEPFGGCAFRQKNGGQAGANHSRINQSTNSLIKRELP
jgi:hypothetical protein